MASNLKRCLLLTVLSIVYISCSTDNKLLARKKPRIVISVLIRNKQHILPYFLTALNQLDYPKDRIIVWMYTDYNSDNTVEILDEWQKHYSNGYHDLNITVKDTAPYHADEINGTAWTWSRYLHVIKLREGALQYARKKWADFLFMLDADVVLSNPRTLQTIVDKSNTTVAAPMLTSEETYSNFWHGMTKNYTYKHTDDYDYIVKRNAKDLIGCHEVPMIHSAVLISLQQKGSDLLTYDPYKAKNYDGEADDTVVFAKNAKNHGIPLKVCNNEFYGFVTTPVPGISNSSREAARVTNIKLEALSRGLIIPVEPMLAKYTHYPATSKLGMDKIFMINLKRRHEKRELMRNSFKELGMEVELFSAVDGRDLTTEYLEKKNISVMPGYRDPFHDREMNAGEIGCFLSHYSLWQEILDREYKMTMILEDDVHFSPFFVNKLNRVVEEAKGYKFELLYLGRKVLLVDGETRVADHLVRPQYSYWSLGYILTYEGARKLIRAEPLRNLVPVDEFLPMMFDFHPHPEWKKAFPIRDLRAVSAYPPILQPTHYTGMDGYVSDTEDSEIIRHKLKNEL